MLQCMSGAAAPEAQMDQGTHRVCPCPAGALCAQVVQRLRLRGEDPDQQLVRQVCPSAAGRLPSRTSTRDGGCARHSGVAVRGCAHADHPNDTQQR